MGDPEPPPTASEVLDEQWRPQQVAVLEALRDWAVGFAELNQHLAGWTGLPTSDAGALGHVAWASDSGTPLSPRQLSQRIGMTSGATSVLLGRLERAGLVVRSREDADRRRVTLRPTDEGRERARSFAAFAGSELASTVRGSDSRDLDVALAFLSRMNAAVTTATERLHQHEAAAGTTDPGPHRTAPLR